MVYLTWSFPLLTGSSALLFHSLSFPLLSLSFVSCFLFLFPVVFLCLFNPFSLSISFHFFPLSLFCFSMLLYPLCSLSLSSTLFFLLVFYYRLPGRRVAGSPGRWVAGYHCSSSLKPSAPSRALCSGSNKNFTVNLPDGNGNQLFTIQSLILQSEERVREERRSKSSRKRGSDPNSEMHDDAASFNPSHIASAFPRVWYLARILIAISESSEGRARHSPLWCPFWKVSYKAPGTSVPVGMTMVFSYQDYPWIESIDNGFLRQGWW